MGVVTIWLVVALMTLMGIAALVFDIGRAIIAASEAQNAVDAAALAAAAQMSDSDAAAQQHLQTIVQTHNEQNPAWTVSVEPSEDVTLYYPGSTVGDYGLLEDDQYAVRVTGHIVVPFTFARAVGIDQVIVTRSATALAEGGAGGDGILFAGETRPGIDALWATGSNLSVYGTMHSNTQVSVTGTGHTITGDLEYRYAYNINDEDDVQGRIIETEIEPYPLDYTWEQYANGPFDYTHSGNMRLQHGTLSPGRWFIDGDLRIQPAGAHLQDLLLVVDGDIRFNGSGVILDNVTMVATGEIRFNGTTERFSAYVDDLFAMSLSSQDPAIRINGSNSETWGIIFAPNGGVVYNGGSQEVHHGAVVANTITIHGAGSSFRGMGDEGFGESRVRVSLIG